MRAAKRTALGWLASGLLVVVAPRGTAAQEAATTPPPDAAEEPGIANPPMVVGGAALGLTGVGAAGLGVYLTLKGSTISCLDCAGSSEDAPLVAGGLTAILLGLGMASSGAMLVVLGARDEPRGLRVRTIRVGAGGASVLGEF